MDAADPRRANDRRVNDDAARTESKTEREDPKRAMPQMDTLEPMRAKDRIERELPM